MTPEHDPRTRTVLSWLREDAHENAERFLLRALDEVDTTSQRRPWWPARRIPDMHVNARLAIGLAAVAVLAVVGINLLTVNRGLVAGPTASPATSAAAAPLPSPSNSPAAQAPPSSGDPRPSASASLQPTATPDAEAVRMAAAAAYLAADGRATDALLAATPKNNADTRAGAKAEGRRMAEAWGLFVAAMKQLEVPADTEADLRALIRKATAVQELYVTQPPADGTDAWWSFRRVLRNKFGNYEHAVTKVRDDLGLPGYCWEPSVCGEDGPPF